MLSSVFRGVLWWRSWGLNLDPGLQPKFINKNIEEISRTNQNIIIFPIIKDKFPTFTNLRSAIIFSIYKWSMFHSYVSLLQLFSSVPYGTNPFVLRGRAQLCTSLDLSRFSRPHQGTRLRLKAEEAVFCWWIFPLKMAIYSRFSH